MDYSLDLARLSAAYEAGTLTPSTVVRDVYTRIVAAGSNPIWIYRMPQEVVAGEQYAVAGARDVSAHGRWRAYLKGVMSDE